MTDEERLEAFKEALKVWQEQTGINLTEDQYEEILDGFWHGKKYWDNEQPWDKIGDDINQMYQNILRSQNP